MNLAQINDHLHNNCLSTCSTGILGLWLSVASTVCASMMGLFAKLAGNRGVPVFEIVLARSLVLMVLTVPQLVLSKLNPLRSDSLAPTAWHLKGSGVSSPPARCGMSTPGLPSPHTVPPLLEPTSRCWAPRRKRLLLLRGTLGFGAVSTYYWTVQYLPLSDTAVLMFLAPLFVAALSPLLLQELPSRGVWTAIPCSIAGVVLVAQPTFMFGGQQALSVAGVVLGICQAALSASAKMCIRALGSTEHVAVIVSSMAAVSLAASSLLCAALPRHFLVPQDAATWGLLLATGLCGFGNQYLGTAALKLSRAAPAIAMSYVSVLWGLLMDVVVFHDAPGGLSLLGAALVCGSSYLVVRSEQQRGRGEGGSGPGGGGGGRQGAEAEAEVVPLLSEAMGGTWKGGPGGRGKMGGGGTPPGGVVEVKVLGGVPQQRSTNTCVAPANESTRSMPTSSSVC